MKHRFRYIASHVAPEGLITLAAEDAHHLTRVVRRGVGDTVEIIDDRGDIWDGVVEAVGDAVTVRVGAIPRSPPRRPDLELAIGLAEWGRLDLVVEKATEIGVRRIVIFQSERAGRVPAPEAFAKRRDRMERVVEAAMRQSGHSRGPRIDGIATLDDVLAEAAPVILIDPRADIPLGDAIRRTRFARCAW